MKVIENKRQVFTEKEEEKASRSGWSFRKLMGSFVTNTFDEEKTERVNGNILFNTLTLFIQHFANFGMSIENGHRIIMYFADKYSLDESRT